MQRSMAEVRSEAGQAYGELASAGERFLRVLDMLQEASNVQAAIVESRKARARRSSPPSEPTHLSASGAGGLGGFVASVPLSLPSWGPAALAGWARCDVKASRAG